MRIHNLLICLIVSILIAPAAAEEGAADPHRTIEWVGKQRDEVIKLLGEPVKSKKSGKGEILIFHGPLEWFAESTDLDRRSGQVAVGSEEKDGLRIGVSTTTAGASPADDHEIITDSEGNPVGAYGRAILAAGTGVVTVHRLKLFLDEKGYVYRIKVGKQVAK